MLLCNYVECSVKSDVVFVIDSSISVTKQDFEKAKKFIHNFTESLSTDGNKVGVIVFETTARNPLPLENITVDNKGEILQTINNISHVQGLTNTADGLCKLTQQNWRRNNFGVLKVAIVLTDGNPYGSQNSMDCGGNTEHVIKSLRTNYSDILIFAVGIGSSEFYTELSLIASKPHLISALQNYSDRELSILNGGLRYQICYTRI